MDIIKLLTLGIIIINFIIIMGIIMGSTPANPAIRERCQFVNDHIKLCCIWPEGIEYCRYVDTSKIQSF